MYAILFDIDGTLLSSGGAGKAAMEAGLQEEFGLPGLRDEVTYSGRTDRAIGFDLLRMHEVAPTEENLARLHEAYLSRLPKSLHASQGKVLPGILPLLQHLTQRDDVVVGLLTGNIRRGARIKLGHFGLWEYFQCGGFGDAHLCRNEVAREALATLCDIGKRSYAPERIWVIGDTPLDVACARAIGANVAAVATGWHTLQQLRETEPDLLFDHLADPKLLLDVLPNANGR